MRPFVIALSLMITLAPLAAAGDKKPNPFSFGLPKQEQKKEAPPAKVEDPAAKPQPPQQETPPAAPEAPAEDTASEAEQEPAAAPVVADANPQGVPVDASVAQAEVAPVEANDAPAVVTPAVAVKETEVVTPVAAAAPKTGAPAKSVAQRSTFSTFQFQLPDDASAPGGPTEKAPKEKPKKKTFGFQLPGS